MMELSESLIMTLFFASIIPAAFMCYYPMKDQLAYPTETIVLRGAAVLVVLLPAAGFASVKFSNFSDLIYLSLLALLYLFYHRSLTVDVSRSLAVFMWVTALMSILLGFVYCVDARLNPALGADSSSLEGAVTQLILSFAAAIISFYPARKYGAALINFYGVSKVWYITIPVTGIFFTMSYLLAPKKYETLYVNRVFAAYICTTSLMLAAQLLLTVIFYHIVMSMIDMMKTAERNRILEMQESRYIKQQKYIEDTAKLRHDFKHTIRTLCELAGEGEYEELNRYLSDYLAEMPQNDTVYYCKNNSINAVLNYYQEQAVSSDIDVTFRIELPDTLPFSNIDMCGIIGNILDNAVTACRDTEPGDRRIQFTMMTQNNAQLVIVSLNSFSGRLKKQGERYLSTNRKGSGLGLTSISETALRCGGEARFSHDIERKEFYIDIMLPLKQAAGSRED